MLILTYRIGSLAASQTEQHKELFAGLAKATTQADMMNYIKSSREELEGVNCALKSLKTIILILSREFEPPPKKKPSKKKTPANKKVVKKKAAKKKSSSSRPSRSS